MGHRKANYTLILPWSWIRLQTDVSSWIELRRYIVYWVAFARPRPFQWTPKESQKVQEEGKVADILAERKRRRYEVFQAKSRTKFHWTKTLFSEKKCLLFCSVWTEHISRRHARWMNVKSGNVSARTHKLPFELGVLYCAMHFLEHNTQTCTTCQQCQVMWTHWHNAPLLFARVHWRHFRVDGRKPQEVLWPSLDKVSAGGALSQVVLAGGL